MLPTVVNRLLLAVGVFVLYLISFFVFGPDKFGPAYLYWFSTLLALAATLFSVWAARVAEDGQLRPFFWILSASLLLLAVQQALYLQDPLDVPYHVANTLFLYFWGCAWVLLALYVVRTIEPPRAVTRLLAFVLVSLAVIYVVYLTQIHPEQGSELDDYLRLPLERRFAMVASMLEAVGLFFGLLVVILGARTGYVLAVLGFSVFAASDFVFLKLEEHKQVAQDAILRLQPLWDVGTLFVLLGLLTIMHRARDAGGATGEELGDGGGDHAAEGGETVAVRPGPRWTVVRPVVGEESGGRSGLAALLAVLTLGAIFVSASAAVFLEEWPEWLLLLYLLFCVAWLLVIARLTLQFDRAVDFAKDWLQKLLRNRLRPPRGWKGAKGAPWRLVEMTRLGGLLGSVETSAGDLRRDLLFLGPARIYGTVAEPGPKEEVSCFVVMPFGQEWSEEVHEEVRDVCRQAGVRPIRGDDVLSPGSFVEDIWQQIHRADFVIADITGNNANVFYELGIAHTIAKPVLILTQEPEKIPADLSTLRAIPYAAPGAQDWPGEFRKNLTNGIEAVRHLYGLAGAVDAASGRPGGDGADDLSRGRS